MASNTSSSVNRKLIWVCACVWGSSACGGPQKGADDASGAGEKSAASESTPWSKKTREQRMDWMGLEVFPKMRAAFTDHDAEKFSAFACQTCHGSDMEMVDFKMPNDKIFALSKTDTLTKARDFDANMTEFMTERVVPEMAQLLDTKPYDPETNTGLSCFNCHPSED
jgi:hypothetical protein